MIWKYMSIDRSCSFPHFFSGALMIFIIYRYDSLFSTLRLQVLQVQQELLMPQGVSQERISYERRKGSVGTLLWITPCFFKGWHCHLVHKIVFRVRYIFVPGVTLVTIGLSFGQETRNIVYLLFKQLGSIKSRNHPLCMGFLMYKPAMRFVWGWFWIVAPGCEKQVQWSHTFWLVSFGFDSDGRF